MEKDRYFRIKNNIKGHPLCDDHKAGGVYRASDEQDYVLGRIGLDVTPFGEEPYVWYYEKDCLEEVFEENIKNVKKDRYFRIKQNVCEYCPVHKVGGVYKLDRETDLGDFYIFGEDTESWIYHSFEVEEVFEEGSVDLGESFTKAEDLPLRDIDKLEAYLEGMYDAYGGQNAEEASRVIGLIIEKVRKLKR